MQNHLWKRTNSRASHTYSLPISRYMRHCQCTWQLTKALTTATHDLPLTYSFATCESLLAMVYVRWPRKPGRSRATAKSSYIVFASRSTAA